MSSTILWLAIIAIWACVLIPRWLKRGAVAPVAAPATTESAGQAAPPDVDEVSGYSADETPAAEPLTAEPVPPRNARRMRMLNAWPPAFPDDAHATWRSPRPRWR